MLVCVSYFLPGHALCVRRGHARNKHFLRRRRRSSEGSRSLFVQRWMCRRTASVRPARGRRKDNRCTLMAGAGVGGFGPGNELRQRKPGARKRPLNRCRRQRLRQSREVRGYCRSRRHVKRSPVGPIPPGPLSMRVICQGSGGREPL